LALFALPLHLSLQRTIEAVVVHLFVFQKLVVLEVCIIPALKTFTR
jgi:hypothetical protein